MADITFPGAKDENDGRLADSRVRRSFRPETPPGKEDALLPTDAFSLLSMQPGSSLRLW